MGSRPDIRDNRLVYVSPCCDVARSDVVGVASKPASDAFENGLSAAVGLVNQPALRTRPRCVPRVHCDEHDASSKSLVRQKRAKLIEGPAMQTPSLSAASNRYPVSNPTEVLDGDPSAGVSGLGNDPLADPVVFDGLESPLLSGQLLQVALCTLAPDSLQTLAKRGVAVTHGLYLIADVGFSIGIDGDVGDAEVNTKRCVGGAGSLVLHLHADVERELAIAVDQVSLSSGITEQIALMISDAHGHDDSPIERQDADLIDAISEAVDPLVVLHGSERSELGSDLAISAVDLADLGDGTHGHLRAESESAAKLGVVELLQEDLVGDLLLEGEASEPVAGLVDSPDGIEQELFLLRRHGELDRRDELHGEWSPMSRLTTQPIIGGALPPRPEGRGFRATEW